MRRALAAGLLLALAALPARAGPLPALRIGVRAFETAASGVDGAAAADLFAAALSRSFPGLSIVERPRVEAALQESSLDCAASGAVATLERSPAGDGGTLTISARLVKVPSGEILWADTRTVRIRPPLLTRVFGAPRRSGPDPAAELLRLGVFELVQDLGKRLPREALSEPSRRRRGEDEACSIPAFYEALPRDDDWYYGAGKAADAGQARAAALASLAEQATGRSAGAAESFSADTGLLAGWEQDDAARCGGSSYVLIRIRKEQIRRALAEGGSPKALSLGERLDRVEERNARLLAGAASTPSRALAPLLVKDTVASVKALLASAGALDEVARANVASAELIFSDLASPQDRCGARNCPAGPSLEQAGMIAAARRRVAAGTVTMDDLVKVHAVYSHFSKDEDDRDFLDAVLSRKRVRGADGYERVRELAFPLAWSSALLRDDWVGFFKYCTEYLRLYPTGIYAAAAEKNRENAASILIMRNTGLAAAPGGSRAD
jgi:hypothetical protein